MWWQHLKRESISHLQHISRMLWFIYVTRQMCFFAYYTRVALTTKVLVHCQHPSTRKGILPSVECNKPVNLIQVQYVLNKRESHRQDQQSHNPSTALKCYRRHVVSSGNSLSSETSVFPWQWAASRVYGKYDTWVSLLYHFIFSLC